ncbi:hypothetical protein JOF56_000213 [Kibdelosporangium banguiense]|uniref:Uncharacterized protein n=1 Tax=Kibdelosporangium banguiense TaxID=1365924 RepID=A0ABS4T5X4_9PSEU|nr:hypothetical protein [Kibdelosporangium banguiense]MBP2319828.1 hypothetical protein [Kibdelosporangium banguiense]
MSDTPAKPEEDPAKDWLAETFPEPEPWPEPRPPAPQPQEVQQLRHTRLGDGLRGAAALAAGLYVYDAVTDDSDTVDTGGMDMGSGSS